MAEELAEGVEEKAVFSEKVRTLSLLRTSLLLRINVNFIALLMKLSKSLISNIS